MAFYPPPYYRLLAVICGTGIQFFTSLMVTLILFMFSDLQFIDFFSILFSAYVGCGYFDGILLKISFFAGFTSVSMMRMWGKSDWFIISILVLKVWYNGFSQLYGFLQFGSREISIFFLFSSQLKLQHQLHLFLLRLKLSLFVFQL